MSQVSLHVDMVGQNAAGSVFSNPPAKLVVLRWESHENLVTMVNLVKMAHTEMTNSGADTVVYDMRRIPSEEGLLNDVMTRIQALKSKSVRRVAWLATTEKSQHPEVVEELLRRNVQDCVGESFAIIGSALDAMGAEDGRERIAGEKSTGFQATYAGSWYFLPELNATVMRTAGNTKDQALSTAMFEAAFKLHKKSGATAVILDSSATPTITDMGRYIHVYQNFIVPMGNSGLYKQAIHVRSGDPLFTEGAPPVGPLVTSFGVPLYEVAMMDDALSLLHLLRGKTRQVSTVRTIVAEAK